MEIKQEYLDYAIYFAIALVSILVLFNIYNTMTLSQEIDKKIQDAKTLPPLPKVTIYVLKAQNCNECFDMSQVASSIEQSLNADVTIEETTSSELISKYSITRLPALVLEGEISSFQAQLPQGYRQVGNAIVFDSPPPYYDLSTQSVRGIVNVTLIEHKGCDQCSNLRVVITSLENVGVKFNDLNVLEHPSEEGNSLVKKYNITKLPVLLISREIDTYGVEQFFQSEMIQKTDEYYVLSPFPPYIELGEEIKLRGKLSAIYLVSSSCENCTSEDIFRNGLSNIGLYVENETTIDINSPEGKELVQKYEIKYVPNVILSGDLEVYPGLIDSWKSYGRYVNGSLIYSDFSRFQENYFDIENNKTITPGG